MSLKVKVITWNVNTKSLKKTPIDLSSLLQSEDADIIALSLQELIHQVKASYKSSSQSCEWSREEQKDGVATRVGCKNIAGLEGWFSLAEKSLLENGYVPLAMGRRVAIGLILFIKVTCAFKVSHVGFGSQGTGLLGVYGNKGSFGISLTLNLQGSEYSVAFLAAHLAPHEGHDAYEWRNIEVVSLLDTLIYTVGSSWKTTQEHDFVVLAGDLNYRLMGRQGVPKWDQIVQWIASKEYPKILALDECILSRSTIPSFWGSLIEGPISFEPTYKRTIPKGIHSQPCLQVTSKTEELYSKKRVPAYCDRVLTSSNAKVISYTTHPEYTFSDHLPVVSDIVWPCCKTNVVKPLLLSIYFKRWNRVWNINQTWILLLVLFGVTYQARSFFLALF